MARPIVAVSSVVVGCLAFAVAARFYADAGAPPPHAPIVDAMQRPRPEPASASGAVRVIRLPPQVIRVPAPAHRRVAVRIRKKPRAADPGWPCSPWRALGPVYAVHEGEKPRQRHVRSLCFGPRPRPKLAEQ